MSQYLDYTDRLQKGFEYQDFVSRELLKNGLVVAPYCSRKYQATNGESVAGIEIKYDGNYQKTGNLYFEYEKKRYAKDTNFYQRGILTQDNTWIYAIGDYDCIFLIPKTMLQFIYRQGEEYWGKWGIKDKSCNEQANNPATSTSHGLAIPIKFLEKYGFIARKIIFSNAGGDYVTAKA